MNLDDLRSDLFNLGVRSGDTLLVRADLNKIGRLESKKRTDYLQAFLDAIGDEGTLIGLSFTKNNFIIKDKNNVFHFDSKPYTGAFANLMLSWPDAIRSRHPTNSYVAIGRRAHEILDDHDEHSGAYTPIRKLIDLKGKMLLVGCADTSPGFTTTHLAEIDLGLHKRIIAPWLNNCFYQKNDEIKLFRRKDLGGCSSTFYRFYEFYSKEGILKQGKVGNADSLMIDARMAYDIDYSHLKDNPRIAICDNPDCFSCRSRRWDNLKDAPRFWFRKIRKKFITKFK